MDCPICGEELNHHDVFGRLCAHQDGKVLGDIYRCENEDCEAQGEHYYTYRDSPEELHEGYPC
jgi:hypothetical protein